MSFIKKIRKEIKTISALPGEVRDLRADVKSLRKTLRQDHAYMNAMRARDERQYFSELPPERICPELADWYHRRTGRKLDLTDPKGYSEKIQWLKMYDSTPLKTMLADKYLVKDYAASKIGARYVPELYGVWTDFDDIDFDSLPDRFVLKANHGCKYNVFVDGKSDFDFSEARRRFKEWMDTNYAYENGFELHYRDIPRVIIAEEYLDVSASDLMDEIKVTCFSGRAELFQSSQRKREKISGLAVYDRDWKRTDYTFGHRPMKGDFPRPERLEELIGAAETLGKGFALARVDFYVLKTGELRFGEITFTPNSGTQKWIHEEHDLELGEKIRLPQKYYLPGVSYEFEKHPEGKSDPPEEE